MKINFHNIHEAYFNRPHKLRLAPCFSMVYKILLIILLTCLNKCLFEALAGFQTQTMEEKMQHSHTCIWIHLIWATKNRERCMFDNVALKIHNHLLEKAKSMDLPFEKLHIQPEHLHGLINLPANEKLSKFTQSIKGESSNWINSNNLMKGHFSWQRGYGAFSVSASQYDIVKDYIRNQKEHHKRVSFQEEYQVWQKKYGVLRE